MRKPRLAGATLTNDRDDARVDEQRGELFALACPTHEARGPRRERARRRATQLAEGGRQLRMHELEHSLAALEPGKLDGVELDESDLRWKSGADHLVRRGRDQNLTSVSERAKTRAANDRD